MKKHLERWREMTGQRSPGWDMFKAPEWEVGMHCEGIVGVKHERFRC